MLFLWLESIMIYIETQYKYMLEYYPESCFACTQWESS